jgi:hypothetical protein
MLKRKYSIFGVCLLLFSSLITIYKLKTSDVIATEINQYLAIYWISIVVSVFCILLIIISILKKLKS